MRFASVFTSLLAVAVTSVSAISTVHNIDSVVVRDNYSSLISRNLDSLEARGHGGHSDIALRYLVNDVYARNLEARVCGSSPPSPVGGLSRSGAVRRPSGRFGSRPGTPTV
ncbi:hypothetical protein EIP91_000474 [Steccherinum ochraceum]|uniref:Uncharacterized protein n=1 Tax=Steccherinum ochraceum TaxID=92696 RepID=A0A4R0RWA3_9APHY|nr:hypothetical protein EIP91_000474 [Steccherinum ochraceum]